MITQIPIGAIGRVHAKVYKDNELQREAKCNNLILDSMISALNDDLSDRYSFLNSGAYGTSRGYIGNRLKLGTGTTPPAASDTSLENEVYNMRVSSSTGDRLERKITIDEVNKKYDFSWTFRYTVPLGALNGNYTEYGIADVDNNLFTRALFKDPMDNPAPLSVSSNEQLVLDYTIELKGFPLYQEIVSNVNGVDYTVGFARWGQMVFSNKPWPADFLPGRNLATSWAMDTSATPTPYTYQYNYEPDYIQNNDYEIVYMGEYDLPRTKTTGLGQRFRINTNEGNVPSGTIDKLSASTSVSNRAWLISITPAIPKSQLEVLEMEFNLEFTRAP